MVKSLAQIQGGGRQEKNYLLFREKKKSITYIESNNVREIEEVHVRLFNSDTDQENFSGFSASKEEDGNQWLLLVSYLPFESDVFQAQFGKKHLRYTFVYVSDKYFIQNSMSHITTRNTCSLEKTNTAYALFWGVLVIVHTLIMVHKNSKTRLGKKRWQR